MEEPNGDEIKVASLLDDGTPPAPIEEPKVSTNERPDYIGEQHWDAEKGEVLTEALSKSFKDTKAALDKRREEGGVPINSQLYVHTREDGSIEVPEGLDHLPPIMANDPALEQFLKNAHELEVPKGTVDKLLGDYFTGLDKQYADIAFDEDNVLAEIDPDPKRATNLVAGVNAYVNQLPLDEAELGVVNVMMQSAAGVHTLAKIMEKAGHRPIAMGVATSVSASNDDVRKEWNKMREDPSVLDNNPAAQARFKELGKKLGY